MLQSEHISREELIAILENQLGDEKTKACEDHLQGCEACRAQMDQLAARSEIWQKAPRLLRRSSESGVIADLGSNELETRDLSPSESESGEQNFGFYEDSFLEPPKHPEMIGRIGRYDIEREIGRGGMGIVFKAHDAELNRPLAIKVLAPHLANHGPARKRFAQEARAAAGVLHPNVIAVHDVRNEGRTPFIVMPYIAGESLQTLVEQNGPLDEIEIVRMALQIAAGLTPAHSQGLVHRDIKPANILVERGANRVIITDFGLARAEDDASMTKTGWLTGTPNYMSPEQTRGEKLDNRSDLFSFGSLLYFLATGRLPFRATSPLGVLNRIQNDEPTPVREANARISPTLANIIHALLKKDAGRRYQSAADLHEVLEQYLAHLHQPHLANPPKVIGTDVSHSRRFVLPVVAIAALLMAAFLGKGFFKSQAIEPMPTGTVLSEIESAESSLNLQDGPEIETTEPPELEQKTKPPFEDEVYVVVDSIPVDQVGNKNFNAGMKALEKQDYEDAIELFEIAASYGKFAKNATYNIGCAWALQGDQEKAYEYLNKALALGFTNVSKYEEDPDLDLLREDTTRFEELLNRVEQKARAESLVHQAKGFVNANKMSEAIELLNEALELDGDNAEAMVNKGYALHVGGELEKAMKWHRAAAATKTQSALGNYNVACVHSLQGEIEKAFEHLEEAIDAGLDEALSIKHIETDADLANIRDNERFRGLLDLTKRLGKHRFGFHVRSDNDDFMEMIAADWKRDDLVEGSFEFRMTGNRVWVSLQENEDDRNLKWSFSTEFKRDQFEPKLEAGVNEFSLAGRQGVLEFSGKLSSRRGSGNFVFRRDEGHATWLEKQISAKVSDALLFRMMISQVDEDEYIENLKSLQGLDLDENTLGALMLHNVKAELVYSYQDRDLDPADYLLFVIWRVPAELIVDYKRYDFDVDEYKKYINQRIPPKLISKYLKAGFDLEDTERFLSARVDPGLLKEYVKDDLDLGKYSGLIINRVRPHELKQYMDSGLNVDTHQEYLRQRIPVSLLKSYQKAGLDLKRFRSYLQARVPAKNIRQYQSAGLMDRDYEGFLKNHVPASLLRSYRKQDLEPTQWRFFVNSRVPADLLRRYRDAGLDLRKHRDFILQRMEPEKVIKYLESLEQD